jgi:UDP-2-acetamido-3-amino-2,3-dideoxy-glucuronate N-acetyltransferase
LPIASRAGAQIVEFSREEPLRAECKHFLESIRTRQQPRTDGAEGLRVIQVLKRCQQALVKTQAVSPPVALPADRKPPYFAHETAIIDEEVSIGEGTTIWHFSHILKNSRLGKECRVGQNVVIGPNVSVGDGVKIQNNVSVYEGVTLEDNVFCGPSVVFTNVINPRSEIKRMDELRCTLVREGATLGANSTIVCGVTIGRYAFVGAGAVVVRDVPDFALVIGNPARVSGWMCVCGNRLDFDVANGAGVCRACQRHYAKSKSGDTNRITGTAVSA